MSDEHRFDRNERLFGREGQIALQQTKVALVGAGGLGGPAAEQLALLGVGHLSVIDDEELSESNRNRYVTARHSDPVPGSPKVDLAKRLVHEINPSISVLTLAEAFPSKRTLDAIRDADFVFGCLDNDGVRFVLNEACLAYEIPLFDLASDVPEPGRYGGRVTIVWKEGDGCLHCRGVLDHDEVRRFLSPDEALDNEAAVYGIARDALGETGPSVVSLNGCVVSLAITEFMVAVTKMRDPITHLEYRAYMGVVANKKDKPPDDCPYCLGTRGIGDDANIERYFGLGRR